MAKYIHEGGSIDYTPGSAVASGDVIVLGDMVCVAKKAIAASELGALETEGVFDFAKATGATTAIAVGKKVYWDVAEAVAKEDDETGANKLIGKTTLAAGDSDATVRVKLSQ